MEVERIHRIYTRFNTCEKQERPTSIARKRRESTSVNRINPTNKHDGTKSPFTSTPRGKNDRYVRETEREQKRERKRSGYWFSSETRTQPCNDASARPG